MTVFYLTGKTIGTEPTLGNTLMKAFWGKLAENGPLPSKVILVGDAVDLACRGSDMLDTLKSLAEAGVDFLVCPICVDYYDEKDSIEVGELTGMPKILEVLQGGEPVVPIC